MSERKYSFPQRTAFDRFIPFRPNLDVEASHARLMSSSSDCQCRDEGQFNSPATKSYTRLLSETTHTWEGKILPISMSPVKSPFRSKMNQMFDMSPDEGYGSPTADRCRQISTSPECIMDMPGIRDDFYTNLLDWSDRNLIAVALHQATYVWNPESKDCQKIEIHFPSPDFYVSALCWSRTENLLAVADNDGEITVCDVEHMKCRQKFEPFNRKCSVGVIQWTERGIISGNRKGEIVLYDVRSNPDETAPLKLHTEHHNREVCGLKLEPGTHYLASGSDEGTVNIWDLRMMQSCQTVKAHTACVKALAWCPWRHSILATGGGSSDKHIRLWHANTGKKVEETLAGSQVCGLLWSEEYTELVSAHGSATPDKNDLVVWDMKKFEFIPEARLRHHLARPLHIALSPDQTTIAQLVDNLSSDIVSGGDWPFTYDSSEEAVSRSQRNWLVMLDTQERRLDGLAAGISPRNVYQTLNPRQNKQICLQRLRELTRPCACGILSPDENRSGNGSSGIGPQSTCSIKLGKMTKKNGLFQHFGHL